MRGLYSCCKSIFCSPVSANFLYMSPRLIKAAMEMDTAGAAGKRGLPELEWAWMNAAPRKLKQGVGELWRNTKKIGRDDSRKIVHSLKVGLALSLVSLFYYCQPLYDSFGVSAMWAVMTVVVVFEVSVGATLSKGLNRGVATLVAGALGVGAHHLASLSGHIGEPILLSFFVFLLAATSTFLRFYPKIKARYDYGLMIFILTFSLISVLGFRDDRIWQLAYKRLSTVVIGGSACVIISVSVRPVWAGLDLHSLIANNLENLANFLQGFGNEYFGIENGESSRKKSSMERYKSILSSQSSEESLANFARWEPGHGPFGFKHPWKQYLKIGSLARECAYRIDALNGYLTADIQAKAEIRERIKEECKEMSWESAKALKELATAIKTMRHPFSADPHIVTSKSAVKKLNSLLKSGSLWEEVELLEFIPLATIASLLIDVVNCTEKIAESVQELASTAHFKRFEPTDSPEKSIPHAAADGPHVVVSMDDDSIAQNGKINGA